MAGIGFELNRILRRRSYVALFQAYAYAGIIGSGPWIIAVLALGALGLTLNPVTLYDDTRILFVSISVIYGLTLVLTGPVQMVLTRFAADQDFVGDTREVFPTFIFSLGWIAFLFSTLGLGLFVGFVPGPILFRLCAAVLFSIVACIWITGIFLTALKDYKAVLFSFAFGFLSSFIAAWSLAIHYDVTGALFGFTFGHAVLLLSLCAAVFKQMGSIEMGTSSFLKCFVRYSDLALGGFLYNLGIWIDKFLYWWVDPRAEHIAGFLRASPLFDPVVYFSFLTIIPGMAIFLLKLETDFSGRNMAFYQHVLKKATLSQLHTLQLDLVYSLRNSFILLFKIQGLFTALLILCSDRILNALHLGAVQSPLFQIQLLAVCLLVMFLGLMTILYYMDKRRDAMICCALLAIVNGCVTMLFMPLGQRWYGFGFLAGAAAALTLAAFLVNYHMKNLEYDTFTKQPVYG